MKEKEDVAGRGQVFSRSSGERERGRNCPLEGATENPGSSHRSGGDPGRRWLSYSHEEGTITYASERSSVKTPISYPAGPPGPPLPASARGDGSSQPGFSALTGPPQSVASLSATVQTPETDQASWGQGCRIHGEVSHLLTQGWETAPSEWLGLGQDWMRGRGRGSSLG